MSKVIDVEKKKSVAGGAKVNPGKFGDKAPRATELATLKEGDIVSLPADWEVLEQEIRNAKPGDDGKKPTAQYTLVEVERIRPDGSKYTKAVPFYPSCLWKRAEVATKTTKPDPADPNKTVETWVGTGEYKVASGTASDAMQEYASVNEFMDMWAEACNPQPAADGTTPAPKRIRVTKLPVFDSLDFNGAHRRTGIGQFDWC